MSSSTSKAVRDVERLSRLLFRSKGQRPLHHQQLGAEGPNLVFLPGVGATTRYWERRVAPLATSNRLLLIDLLGFGQSPKPWTTYTVDRHVAELHRVLAGREPFTLVGHSFGAIAAVGYAARHPGLVNGLVLIGLPHFGSEEGAVRHFSDQRSLDGWLLTNVALAAVACVLTRRVVRWALPYVLRDLPREIVEDMTTHTWRSSTSTIWDGIYRHDAAVDVARLRPGLPVLFLHGEEDPTAPLEGAQTLAAMLPNATLRVLPGGDHHPLLREPAWCLAEIRTFLFAQAIDGRRAA